MSSITDNLFSIYSKIVDRNSNTLYVVEADRPVTLIGLTSTILTDDSETIDLKVVSNNVTYYLLKSYRIENSKPDNLIKILNRLTLNPGDSLIVQANNSFGVSVLPEIHFCISFVRQPKLK